MRMKKVLAVFGALFFLGFGWSLAAERIQSDTHNPAQRQVTSRFQVRTLFVDENGDGICDFARDHDNDGIPNNQDPDWTRPQDGSGNKFMKGTNSNSNRFGNRNGNQGGNSLGRHSFQQNRGQFGSGVCDGTGVKGNSKRGGRGSRA